MRGPAQGEGGMIPGEVLLDDAPVWINAGKPTIVLTVVNTGDRPVQVGSHYHLAEANPALRLDREAAWGRRLDILAGSAVRFEPGATVEVTLVPIGGARVVRGLRGECAGRLDDPHGGSRAGTPGATTLDVGGGRVDHGDGDDG